MENEIISLPTGKHSNKDALISPKHPPHRASRSSKSVAIVVGAILGVCLLHPITMLLCRLLLSSAKFKGAEDPLSWATYAFTPQMLPMTLLYALFGIGIGYGVGALWERGHELIARRLEIERQKAYHETFQELTLTVAHYVRNANSVIGGYTRRILEKSSPDVELARQLIIIKMASEQIEAVVASLQTLDSEVEKEEIGKTHLRMIDIRAAVGKHMETFSPKNVEEMSV